MTDEPLTTVSAVLNRLDTSFSDFTAAFDEGQYVLWFGSGISRDRVPNVYTLLERVIEALRSSIDQDNQSCPYRNAFDEVLALASLTADEQGTVDTTVPFTKWLLRDRITGVLANHYSKVLDVRVEGHANDYLVWDVLDVRETYGSPEIDPDVEHYCIALLMLEGLVDSAVTANWDGLVEKALSELMPAFDAVARVIVKPDDFHHPKRRVEFLKFHGCAVRARDDDSYRPLLIARMSQISVWATQPQHAPMRKRLESLYTERRTLMLGLSAQDANLHHVFGTAVGDLARAWSPTTAPAIVLSEQALLQHHAHILQITYGSDYDDNAKAISESAVLGSFGKPTLVALVVSSLIHKLKFLMKQVLPPSYAHGDAQQLSANLVALRDSAARHAEPHEPDVQLAEIGQSRREFVSRLIDVTHLALTVFRTGRAPSAGGLRYEPLSDRPIAQAIHNPDFPTAAFGRFGIALALIGRGHLEGYWSAVPGDSKAPEDGVLRLVTGQRDAHVFFVKDAATLTELELDGPLINSEEDVLIVVANEEPPSSTRSPKSRFGRDGQIGAGLFSVAKGVADTTCADELYEAFKLAGGF